MGLKEIMNKNVVFIDKYTTLLEACELMRKNETGSLLISENNKLLGIITDRDIVMYLARHKTISSVVCKAMSKNVLTINIDSSIEDVTDLMGYAQIKRVPIVDDNGFVKGIISLSDLASDENCVDLAMEALKEITFSYRRVFTPPQLALKVDDFPL